MAKTMSGLRIFHNAATAAVLSLGLVTGGFALGTFAAGSALAMGGGGNSGGASSSSGSSTSGGTRLKCPKGFKLSPNKKKCLRQRSGIQDQLPAVGWGDLDNGFLDAAVLAHAGRYDDAIVAFAALDRPHDPYVLTYLGFSNRKLGNIRVALTYYDQALTLRPDYVRARQYLGEGFLALGRFDEAQNQLEQIAFHCGTSCEPYLLLQSQIADYQKAA